MTLKSLLQRLVGIPAREVPGNLADAIRPGSIEPQSNPFIDRLKGRSDWGGTATDHAAQMARVIDPNFPNPPAWTSETDGGGADMVPPWDRPGARYHSPLTCDPWPPNDDPYAVPCEVVPDPALAGLDKLASRGMTRPMDSVKSVTDLLQLIQRQEAAEKLAIKLGWKWDGEKWYCQKPANWEADGNGI